MIKKLVVGILFLSFVISCNRTYEKAMKSKDPEFILNSADKLYEQEKWPYAVELYRKVASAFAGTQEAEDIAYKSAYANYNDKNYTLAAKQFKNFFVANRRSDLAEEALYMSAFSYYQGSPEYNLDQKNTYEAISELQNFIDTYPTSNRVKDANKYINELQEKLERKYYEIARSYYKTLKYKAASVSFANFLDDFPDSDYREEAYIYMVRSRAELALQSVYDKKELRLKDAITTQKLFAKAYPNSEYIREANDWNKRLQEELETFQKLKQERENKIIESKKK